MFFFVCYNIYSYLCSVRPRCPCRKAHFGVRVFYISRSAGFAGPAAVSIGIYNALPPLLRIKNPYTRGCRIANPAGRQGGRAQGGILTAQEVAAASSGGKGSDYFRYGQKNSRICSLPWPYQRLFPGEGAAFSGRGSGFLWERERLCPVHSGRQKHS